MKLRKRASQEDEAATEAMVTPILFGLLTGLMPCGPLIAAEIAAAGSGSPVNGAIAMLGFGLGTIPVMLAFGSATSFISGKAVQKYMSMAAAVVVIVLGVVFLNRGAVLLGSPVSFNTVAQAVTGTPAGTATAFAKGQDGVTEVKVTIKNTQFVPSTVTIPADRPVRLVVDRREDNACSDQIAIPQLGVLKNLAPNAATAVDIPATRGGAYNLTCGMGMMSGTLVAVAGDGSAAQAAQPGQQADTIVPPAAAQAAPADPNAATGGGGCCGSGSAGSSGAGASAAAGGGCCGGGAAKAPASASQPKAAKIVGGFQKIAIDVSKGYYDPSAIVLKAGVPTEITFSQSSGCTGQVVSEGLGFSEDLSSGPKTVKLAALQPGEYGFHCGMNMVLGKVVVK
jgi:plastocyanin domain-containing protein